MKSKAKSLRHGAVTVGPKVRVQSMLSMLTAGLITWCIVWYLNFVPNVWTQIRQVLDLPRASDHIATPSATSDEAASHTLLPLAFTPLPLGSIKPSGWLASELSNSANGLAGHLHDFYAYIRHSPWYGGDQEYAGLNEGFPYWFNGLVPLAYGLPDSDPEAERLKAQVHEAADYVLSHQSEDGWLGPERGKYQLLWARFPLLLGMTGLAEANSTWEARIVPALQRFVRLSHSMLKEDGRGYVWQGRSDPVAKFDYSWGRVRAPDFMITLQWMLEKHLSDDDAMLWESMQMLYDMSLKWEAWYNEATYIKEDLWRVPGENVDGPHFAYEHGVNVGQGLKAPAVVHRFTKNDSLLQTASDAVQWTFQYHGAASGTVLGDERIVGLSPYSGSELCTVVETMFSLSYLYQALGTNALADRVELATFNALPAMMTGDHWAHQYMAQANQPYSKKLSQSPFWNSGVLAQTFGLEPNYPCCTVNHHQGWPKFLANSWSRVGGDGFAHVLLSPGSVRSSDTTIECETKYPFGDSFTYRIHGDSSVKLYIRVPEWADHAASSLSMNGEDSVSLSPDPVTGLHKVELASGESVLTFNLNCSVRTQARANDTIAVYRGALLFALEVNSTDVSMPPRSFNLQKELPDGYAPRKAVDWNMTNTSAWNVAIDPSTLTFHSTADEDERLPSPIFEPGAPPVYMTATGCQIKWPLHLGSVPGAVPPAEDRKCIEEPYEVRLRPYGSAKLHMAELPTIDLR